MDGDRLINEKGAAGGGIASKAAAAAAGGGAAAAVDHFEGSEDEEGDWDKAHLNKMANGDETRTATEEWAASLPELREPGCVHSCGVAVDAVLL